MRPRRLEPGDTFTWRFKKQDYWEAIRVPQRIETVGELMALHEPWVTSSASKVWQVITDHGGQLSLNDEGLIVVEVDDGTLEQLNSELGRHGCTLSNEFLHTL